MSKHALPLSGLKVLDFTRVLAGPFASMMMGDLGAEVIKVEPLTGDESRSWPPFLQHGQSGYFCVLNRNKRSVTLNLKAPEGREIARRLAAEADVVLENFTPGVVAKLGIDYASLAEANPGLIYCSISGFGQSGPYRDKKAYDPIIQGLTGLMSITGEKDRSPVKVGIPITDLAGANNAVIAVLAAYIHRLKTGQGQYIDVALYDGMIALLSIMAVDYFATGRPPGRWGLDHIHRVPARAFEAKDGKYVQVAATSDVMFPKFCDLIGLPDLADDPRFVDNSARIAHREEIATVLEAKMREKTRDEWLDIFENGGIPCGPIYDIQEVFADGNIAARQLYFEMDHPLETRVPLLGFPFKFAATPLSARLRPPLLGEHTAGILGKELGISDERIVALKEAGVI